MHIQKISFSIVNLINFLLFLFPISFILGNFIINLEIFFISILGIILYKKDLFKITKDIQTLLILFFFAVVLLSTLVNYFQENGNTVLKSFLYLRYLIFLLVIKCLIKNNDFNIKYFLFSCLFCSVFLSVDVIYQFFSGKDFFGFPKHLHVSSGFFGDEHVAGGYIQKFGSLGIFIIPFLFFKKKEKLFNILVPIFIIFFIGIFLSGNRMPVVLFIIYSLLILIFIKEIRIPIMIASILSLIISIAILNTDEEKKTMYSSFYYNAVSIFPMIFDELGRGYPELEDEQNKTFEYHRWDAKKETKSNYFLYGWLPKKKGEEDKKKYKIFHFGSGHAVTFITAIDTWMDRPILGNGIKSFGKNCAKKRHLPNRTCQSHPHNYYLDILNDTGLIGLIFIISSLFLSLFKKFKSYKKKVNKYYFIFWVFIFVLLIEFFPFRSSGGFFSTWNSAYIFFIIAIVLSDFKKNFKS